MLWSSYLLVFSPSSISLRNSGEFLLVVLRGPCDARDRTSNSSMKIHTVHWSLPQALCSFNLPFEYHFLAFWQRSNVIFTTQKWDDLICLSPFDLVEWALTSRSRSLVSWVLFCCVLNTTNKRTSNSTGLFSRTVVLNTSGLFYNVELLNFGQVILLTIIIFTDHNFCCVFKIENKPVFCFCVEFY